jgi:Domain of unknown function (DUF5666)
MSETRTPIFFRMGWLFLFAASAPLAAAIPPQPVSSGQQQGTAPAATRRIGAIKAISGTSITLTPDAGVEVSVVVQETTHIRRIAPGEKNLNNATAVQLQDLQVGDRILVAGQASADGKSITAATIVVMARSDIEASHQKELQDWQKRGIGGLVSAVDAATGTVTISVSSMGGKKTIAVHSTKDTVIRRYAPDSVKFDDAKVSTLQEIHPGDQLRARGDRSADGSEVAAEEIVTGSFRNVAGTVNSVDASAGTVSVQDVFSKKAVVVKVSADSQLHQLPADMAQRIAARLKAAALGGVPGGAAVAGASPAGGQPAAAATSAPGGQPGAPSGSGTGPGGMGGARSGGTPDFQQMLSRLPAAALADLHKGDAVMMVTTQGTGDGGGTAITLVSGVDALLRASPSGSQAMMLAPWSLGGAPAGGEGP